MWYQLSVARRQGSHVVPVISRKRVGQSVWYQQSIGRGQCAGASAVVGAVKTTAGIQPVLASGGYINCE